MSIQTKNQIKNRMVKKAAELWGVSPNDIDSSFDPVVSLLLGACASELSKISTEVNKSQSRISERLIELMSPDTSSGSQPAHAIAHAMPTEPFSDIVPANQLYAKKKIKNNDGEVSFKTAYFSPIKPFKLVNSYIQYALTGNKILSFENDRKTIDSDTVSLANSNQLPNSSIYLGFSKTKEKISLKQTSLFFELNDISNHELFYNQLKQAKFYFNDTPIDVEYGFQDSKTEDSINIDNIFSNKPQKSLTIENQTATIYRKHYVTIVSDCLLNSEAKNEELLNHIDLKTHDDFEEMNWIKVVFPNTITNKILSNLYVAVNTFPVLNRRLESTSYILKDFSTIVPFSTTDLFLDIRKITNDNNREYTILDTNQGNQKGTYTLRDESVGRLDSKKAKDHLTHLLELLKNESAAFSVLGNDFLQTNIQKLNQNISALEDRVAEMSLEVEENHYLSLKPYSNRETIFIDFWSTIGAQANLIKTNAKLQVYKGADIDTQKCFLVTPTSQGKNSLTTDEKLYKYRRMLLSRERIVTREDVKALCFDICGNKIENVTLSKEFKTHPDYNKGLIPTIVVEIKKNNEVKVENVEWIMIKNNILSVLEEKSTNLFPYLIKLID